MSLTFFPKKLIFILKSLYRRCFSGWRTETFPISDFRNLFGTGFCFNDGHHLVDTLNFIGHKTGYKINETPIFDFHNSFLPKTFFDVSGIKGSEALPIFVYPWGSFSDGSATSSKDIKTSRFLGPSDESLIISEVDSIINLCKSIKEKGFDPYGYLHSDINGTILISADGSKRVCVVMQGNHRVAVMSFLGFKSIAIKPGVTCLGFVHESEVESWPLVKAGVVSVNCALEIFNFFIRK